MSGPKNPVWLRAAAAALVLVCLGLLALRAFHLDADFPNHSRWRDDGAKFTDEGWYASAALNSAVWGRWYLPGDWSPAVVMPVWPAMVHGVYHFTGVSVIAARALEVVFSWLVVLLGWAVCRRVGLRVEAWAVFLLLSASSIGYAFGRLALLEAPLVALTLLAVLASIQIKSSRAILAPVMVGLLLPLMVLTKTTAVFLIPAVLFPIAFRCRENWREAIRPLLIIVAVSGIFYGSEQVLFAHRYAPAAHDFFSHSPGRVALKQTAEKTVRFFYRGVTWIDPILFPIALAGLIASCWMRELWRNELWGVAVLWNAGYAAFIIYHFDGPPRYFNVMVVPIYIMAVMFTAALWRRGLFAGRALAALCTIAFLWNSASTVRMARHPQYTFLNATQQIKSIILAHPESSHVILGHGDAQIEMFTELPAVDDTHGYMSERDKVLTFKPGWVVVWNSEPLSDLGDVMSLHTMARMGEFPAMDEPKRSALVLYQLQPKPGTTAPYATNPFPASGDTVSAPR